MAHSRSAGRFVLATVLALLALISTSCAAATRTEPSPQAVSPSWTELNALVGYREYDDDDFGPIEEQTSYAAEFSAQQHAAFAGWELGASFAEEDDDVFVPGIGTVDVEAETMEVYGGARKNFETGSIVRPYLGAGLTLLRLDASVSLAGGTVDDDDISPGLYLHGGVLFDVTPGLHLGVDLRAVLLTELEIGQEELDADYQQAAVVLGFSL